MERSQAPKILSMLTGGPYSTTMLYYLLSKHERKEVEVISFDFDYRRVSKRELSCAFHICQDLDLKHHVIKLTSVRKSIATKLGGREYLAYRNMIALSVACGLAYSRGIGMVYYHAYTSSSLVTTDYSSQFCSALKQASLYGATNGVRIETPFIGYKPVDIIKVGIRLNVPYLKTWTCIHPQKVLPCGRCEPCKERYTAFRQAGELDALIYEVVQNEHG